MSQGSEIALRESGSRERLAWAVLLTVFAIWLAFVVSIPLLGSRYLQTSTKPLVLAVQANNGTVRVEGGEASGAIFTSDPPSEVKAPVDIATDAGDSGTLLVYEPDAGLLLGRIEVHADTSFVVATGETPRFNISGQDAQLDLDLHDGRLRLKLLPVGGRPFVVSVSTPNGDVQLPEAGQYAIEAGSNETQVTVLEGKAELVTDEASLILAPDERGVVTASGELNGPLETERSLVVNGDFQEDLARWDELIWNIELTDQPQGTTEVVEIDGERALRFQRVGEGHADSGIRQTINQDVTDFKSIRLEVSLLIADHSVAVCGSLGSECPLTLRVQYEDANGNDQVWQQGFFANGDALAADVPDVCVSCAPPRPEHERVTSGQFAFYRVELLELLPQYGMVLPSKIKSISILTAGHSFDVSILDVNLIAQE